MKLYEREKIERCDLKKERPGELNKKIKRLHTSRDQLKSQNRENALQNRRLNDRNKEITHSRDHWKTACKEAQKELKEERKKFTEQLRLAERRAQTERERAEAERKRAEQLQIEMEKALKKNL